MKPVEGGREAAEDLAAEGEVTPEKFLEKLGLGGQAQEPVYYKSVERPVDKTAKGSATQPDKGPTKKQIKEHTKNPDVKPVARTLTSKAPSVKPPTSRGFRGKAHAEVVTEPGSKKGLSTLEAAKNLDAVLGRIDGGYRYYGKLIRHWDAKPTDRQRQVRKLRNWKHATSAKLITEAIVKAADLAAEELQAEMNALDKAKAPMEKDQIMYESDFQDSENDVDQEIRRSERSSTRRSWRLLMSNGSTA